MENSCNDDSRKKRDSTDVVEGDSKQSEEKTKKLRAAEQWPILPAIETLNDTYSEYQLSTKPTGCVLDLEFSLQKLVTLGICQESKEYLSKTKWVQFRIGHAGDASTLASLYRKTCAAKVNPSIPSQIEDTSLEVRLAEGLGDEDSSPSIFALLVDVVDDTNGDCMLGAAALISSGWDDSTKVMRVKMFYVSDDDKCSDIADLLERRMWLRLSALALMTSNQMIVEQGVTNKQNHMAA